MTRVGRELRAQCAKIIFLIIFYAQTQHVSQNIELTISSPTHSENIIWQMILKTACLHNMMRLKDFLLFFYSLCCSNNSPFFEGERLSDLAFTLRTFMLRWETFSDIFGLDCFNTVKYLF